MEGVAALWLVHGCIEERVHMDCVLMHQNRRGIFGGEIDRADLSLSRHHGIQQLWIAHAKDA